MSVNRSPWCSRYNSPLSPTLDTLHPLHTTIDVPKLHNLATDRFACQYQLPPSAPPPSVVMACIRSMTHQSMTIPLARPASGRADRHTKSARRPSRSILPQFDLSPMMRFHPVRMESDTAKENIRRLFYQEKSAAIFFHSRHDKVGVCWKLSASPPETYPCTYAPPHTLDSLFMCLYNVFEGENPITEA